MPTKKIAFKPVDPKRNFVELEKEILNKWEKDGILKKYLARNNKSRNKFRFLDGPITANNPMGVHHAWGRALKDLWQRFYNMKGYVQRFQNGFDEQGLWIEVEVEKELGFKNKKDIEKYGIDKFVEKCKERVKKYALIQTEQSKRLGYFMDWENSYHTSSEENNYAIWNFLKVCKVKGYLYKGRDSVPWCPRCGTAISQHEILTEEYKEIKHTSILVRLPIVGRENEFLLIWTTTPWTIPGNVAVGINRKFKYVKADVDGKLYYVAESRLGFLKETNPKVVINESVKSEQLLSFKYTAPFDHFPRIKKALTNYEHSVIDAKEIVNEEEGTGLLHIAPGAGQEDFKLGKEHKLPVIELIDESAVYLNDLGDFTGANAKNDPEIIINYLRQHNDGEFLFKVKDFTHRYPTCWRCKTELVWRVVDEWYIAMDRPSSASGETSDGKSKKTLREQMIAVAKTINWIPKFGLDRELDWLKNMHDWLISKKRYWGLALPIWECSKCGHFEVIGSKEELKEKAIEGWSKFEGKSPHRPQIDEVKIKCRKCGQTTSRIPDVGNVWLDAGIVPISTMPQDWFPADFITESFPGQFKNWFYSLISMSTVLKNSAPFKTVLGFATLLDEKGEEMHKSKGNAIEFNQAADKIGVDVMRWLYLTQNPAANLLFGYHKADEVRRRFYLILWNVYSFFVTYANLNKWQPDSIGPARNILDRWAMSRLNNLIEKVNGSLSKYDSMSASLAIEDFVINDLSTWYVRRSRVRVEEALPSLYLILRELSKIIASFLPFIAEEIYTNLTNKDSVHLSGFPQGDKSQIDQKLEKEMLLTRMIVEKAHAKRKEAGIRVRQPLSRLNITLPETISQGLEKIIADEVNVKKIEIKKGKTLSVNLDTKITPQLKIEGQAREIIRQIQQARKDAGCQLSEEVTVKLPSWPKEYEDMIKRETLSKKLLKSQNLEIVRS